MSMTLEQMVEIVRKADVFNDYGMDLLMSDETMHLDQSEILKIVQAAVCWAATIYGMPTEGEE